MWLVGCSLQPAGTLTKPCSCICKVLANGPIFRLPQKMPEDETLLKWEYKSIKAERIQETVFETRNQARDSLGKLSPPPPAGRQCVFGSMGDWLLESEMCSSGYVCGGGGSRQTQENFDISSGGPGVELVTDVRNPGKQTKQSLTLGEKNQSYER